MGVYWIPIVTSIGCYIMITMIVMAIVRGKTERAKMHADVQAKMVERFGTAPEFIEYLRSAEGKAFMGAVEQTQQRSALDRVVSGFSKATVTAFLGLGFIVIYCFPDTRFEGFLIAGVILLMLGLGFILSALVSLKLSRNWGLVGTAQRDEP
ncbi:MAG TPA: hypothetical protein VGR02_07820 [Thermoanaerobaculia bacterium]|jgi:hypothetical protein|nr:hypothetical protein [Thermoanaerobaculia bacterium]